MVGVRNHEALAWRIRDGSRERTAHQVTGTTRWYKRFLDNAVIPHGWAVGWIVLVAEILVGVVLRVGAILWFTRWSRLSATAQQVLVALVTLAAISAILMNISFHLANGATRTMNLALLGRSRELGPGKVESLSWSQPGGVFPRLFVPRWSADNAQSVGLLALQRRRVVDQTPRWSGTATESESESEMGMHMLKYHLGVPLVIFAILMVVGVPIGAAIFVGAMAGCMSMMFMMMGGQRPSGRESQRDGASDPRDDRDDAARDASR